MSRMLWICLITLLLIGGSGPLQAAVLGTAFSYQGSLVHDNQPADGSFDFEFLLFPTATEGVSIGGTDAQTLNVTDGIFTALIDFGLSPFNDQERWLEIRVRPAGAGDFETLAPRQLLVSTPYALRAASVAADSITKLELADGAVSAADVDITSVQLRVTGECPPGSSIRDIQESGSVSCEPDDAGASGTGVLMVPPSAFEEDRGHQNTLLFNWTRSVEGYLRLSASGSAAPVRGDFQAPVLLPAGATVTHVESYFFYNDAVGNVQIVVRLYRRVSDSLVVSTMGDAFSAETTGTSTAIQGGADITITDAVVESDAFYWLGLIFNVTGVTSSSDLRFYGARIEYTLP
jgi:hypothetical protein